MLTTYKGEKNNWRSLMDTTLIKCSKLTAPVVRLMDIMNHWVGCKEDAASLWWTLMWPP